MKDLLMVIDGNSLIYRAFYAIPMRPNDNGEYTNAVMGFMNMLTNAISQYNPKYIAVGFDVHGKTIRHDVFEEYKGTRKPTPDELRPQFAILKDILNAMEVKIIESKGYEADDILGYMSHIAPKHNLETMLISGDRDILQLVDENTRVMYTRKGISDVVIYDVDEIYTKYTLSPEKITDLKGLMGDTSDNIPGVKGIGEKTAIKLLTKYDTLENIYEHIDELKGKQKENLVNCKDDAFMSKKLATILRTINKDIDINECEFVPYEKTSILDKLDEYKLNSVRSKIAKISNVDITKQYTPKSFTDVENSDDLNSVAKKLETAKLLSLYKNKDSFCISNGEDEYRFNLVIDLLGNGFILEDVLSALSPALKNAETIIVYHLKEWMSLFEASKVSIDSKKVFDLYLSSYLLNISIRNGIDAVITNRLQADPKSSPAFLMVELYKKQSSAIKFRNLTQLFFDIEMPLVEVIYSMENEGFCVDEEILKKLGEELSTQIDELTAKIYEVSDTEFNIASPKQLGVVLFETLGLDVIKKTKTGYSTDSYVLEKLYDSHEIIPLIIEYRTLAKLKSTYIDGLIPIISKKDNKIHTKLHQAGAVTGRLSSSEPNLQNIPIRNEVGRQIRKAFIPSPNNILISADYSQIELRVLAHIAGESNMIEAFNNKEDIHRKTAADVFGVNQDEVTSSMRSSAKAVNFGIVYGISDFGLARQLDIPTKQAKEFIDKYLLTFPGIKDYMDTTIETGKAKGYVSTMFNRRIYLPDLKATNYNRRSAAERIAMNAPIQGSAADIIKIAMIRVYNALTKQNLKSKLILQVHDELIIDTAPDEIEIVSKILVDNMQNVYELDCPLIANVAQGDSWYEAK